MEDTSAQSSPSEVSITLLQLLETNEFINEKSYQSRNKCGKKRRENVWGSRDISATRERRVLVCGNTVLAELSYV